MGYLPLSSCITATNAEVSDQAAEVIILSAGGVELAWCSYRDRRGRSLGHLEPTAAKARRTSRNELMGQLLASTAGLTCACNPRKWRAQSSRCRKSLIFNKGTTAPVKDRIYPRGIRARPSESVWVLLAIGRPGLLRTLGRI